MKDKEYQLEKHKKEIEKLQKRLGDVERQNDMLEIKKRSLDKQSEIQRKQLLDKIQNLNELVSAEKDTREMWINRYEKEQKAHIATNTELLQAKGNYQDAMLKIKNMEITIESITKVREALRESNDDLQEQVANSMAKKENMERDLYTKGELLRTIEEQQRIYVRRMREEFEETQQEKAQLLCQKEMEYEDLRTLAAQEFELSEQRQ
mmetsp:Transcript_32051/g.31349  ORF Transcript_32051/g.31349 Transcript_32051/m.31349 type:complete len:207 (+) Transcript_32051:1765-2385(+)